jgi:hypothetical chaperone protein
MKDRKATTHVEGGPWAIDKFLEGSSPHRFIQSFKTFAASSAFRDTRIFRERFSFEDLLAAFLRTLLTHTDSDFSFVADRIVIGRPVRFAGAAPDDALAMKRYRASFSQIGIDSSHSVYEPVGAAFFFAQKLKQDATVLVADFGGGTSDFSIIRFERADGRLTARPLGNAGIGIAGDTFDYRIIDHVVSPRLGKGADYLSFGKKLSMPNGLYSNFARWNQLALMKTSGELKELQQLARVAVDPKPILAFIGIIENDLGFALYRSISAAKIALSSRDETELHFAHDDFNIRAQLKRQDFEHWIADDMERIAQTVDKALESAALRPGGIDKVFLTGGSSFIPAIRRIFSDRFGAAKLETGDQFESIAYGLALIGQSDRPQDWTASSG